MYIFTICLCMCIRHLYMHYHIYIIYIYIQTHVHIHIISTCIFYERNLMSFPAKSKGGNPCTAEAFQNIKNLIISWHGCRRWCACSPCLNVSLQVSVGVKSCT